MMLDDVIINVLPLSFNYGLYQLLMSVKMGATLVLESSFAYPFKIVERIHQERVTGISRCADHFCDVAANERPQSRAV